MRSKPAKVTQIDAITYRFDEAAFGEPVYMYLLVGTERALLIDTGYGFTDVPAAIREITKLPLTIVNTHGHMDHMHGNHLYPEVLISEKDEEVFQRHNDSAALTELLKMIVVQNKLPAWIVKLPFVSGSVKKIAASYPSIHKPLPKEMCLELGERKVSIIETPGHTVGSICLLDEKNGWLFSGDNNCEPGVLLSFPESASVEVFSSGIKKLCAMVDEGTIKKIFPSHQTTPLEPDHLKRFETVCSTFLAMTKDDQKKAQSAGAFEMDGIRLALGPNSL